MTNPASSDSLTDKTRSSNQSDLLLPRGEDPHRPSLENRVAFQWEYEGNDIIGYRTAVRRNKIVLQWLAEICKMQSGVVRILDVGCGYGNHLLMLNAYAGKPQHVSMTGVDISDHGLPFAKEFADRVPGYQNCSFQVADIERGLPFPDEHFDACNLADVLEHLVDPAKALAELHRVLRPGGMLVISTPLKTSLFKSIAGFLNKFSGGALYRAYYAGKNVSLDETGNPVMENHAGHGHVSEMEYSELLRVIKRAGFAMSAVEPMPIMSGSAWFNKHPFLLAAILLIEAVHDVLRLPGWAHSVCLKLYRQP